jgi:catechol 2,3-dioxygenase-like lactoylglutathione lyase family enzyme
MTANGVFYVFAFVSDFTRSKEFYGKTLGWELGTDEKDVAGFAFGDGYLVIHADDRPGGAHRYPGGMHVTVKVEDAQAEHARLKQEGVTVSDLLDHPF